MPIKLKTADPISEARTILLSGGYVFRSVHPIDYGTQFKLSEGNVNVYTNGSVVIQGKSAAAVTRAFEAHLASEREAGASPRGAVTASARPKKAAAPAAVTQPSQADGEVSFSRRHPQWSDAPWDGVECPFDVDPPR